jgi:A/G-specific adenine glycosylase
MLQQTQVTTVVPYFNKWLRRFPNFASLARARESDVLHAWQGLGYYARARNLHAAAKCVETKHCGRFPRDLALIRELPGVGRYIANAVATFAFNESLPIVEVNTGRVLARLFNVRSPIDSLAGREQLWRRAGEIVPSRNPRTFNSALMDLGALVCRPRKPRCTICPVKKFCQAPDPENLPIKRARPATQRLMEDHSFIVTQNRVLLQQSLARWRGMWILPARKLDGHSRSCSRRAIYSSVFPFTHHRITLRIFRQRPARGLQKLQRWFALSQLESIPIPSPHRRAIEALMN